MEIIKVLLRSKNVSCFIATETWFREHHMDSMVSIRDYCCFRDDRTERVGGGVALWARDDLQPESVPVKEKPNCIEVVAVKVINKLLIIGAYVPPQVVAASNEAVTRFFIDFVDSFLDSNPLFDVILCGDFNRLYVNNICNACNLVNLHKQPTYGSAELDYILMSENAAASYVVRQEVPIDESKTPHVSLMALPFYTNQRNFKTSHAVYDLRSSNVELFTEVLNNTNWSFLENTAVCLHERCEMFQCHLQAAFETSIPVTYVTHTADTKPWITPLVKHLINERWTAYRERNFSLYNHLKQKVKKEIEKSKVIWSMKLKERNIWKMANELRFRKEGNPMASLYARFESIDTAADMINLKLTDVFSERRVGATLSCHSDPEYTPITAHQVYGMLRKLPSNKASPDLPIKLYKAAATSLVMPLTLIFNESISKAIVPTIWKKSAVIPVPKSPRPVSVDEVRPISLLPPSSKLLEKVMLNYCRPYFLQEYGPDQFGFRPGSSTTCALITLHDHITKCMENRLVAGVQVISYDFSKAFDRLQHDVIIERMMGCDIPQHMIYWFSNYLEDRLQYVRIGDSCSATREVTSGVPQGSVLGPYIFSMVMGALKIPYEDCCVVKYADDVTISVPIYKNCGNLHVNTIHDAVKNWSSRFGLPLNSKKCKCLAIPRSTNFECVTLEGVSLVHKLTILGVTFNERCTWSDHMQEVAKRASRRLFPLRLLKPHVTISQLKTFYFSLMRSLLEYASPLFVGVSKQDACRLQRVQNRFHRLLCGKECKEECLENLDLRRNTQSVRLYSSLLDESHILHKLSCQQSASGRQLLPHISSTRRLNCFTIKAAMLYNEAAQRSNL